MQELASKHTGKSEQIMTTKQHIICGFKNNLK